MEFHSHAVGLVRSRNLQTLNVLRRNHHLRTSKYAIIKHTTRIEIFINERRARGDFPFARIEPTFPGGYIIPSICSFQPASGANTHFHKLLATTPQQFSRDTVNIFGPEDQNHHSNKASLQRPAKVTKKPKVLPTDEVHPKIDSSHKLPVQKKGKRIVGEC
jgi:hypothetical protein